MERNAQSSGAMKLVPYVCLLALGCSAEAVPPEIADNDPASEGFVPADRIAQDDLGVLLPDPGITVGAELHGLDGKTTRLAVSRALDGSVSVVQFDPVSNEVMASPNACSDGAYAHEGFSWNKTYDWWFRASTVPSGYDAGNVETALRRGVQHITNSYNNCGLGDAVSATAAYQGRTSTATNIVSTTSSVTCGKNDGKNVVAFGALPSQYLGITCYWYDGNKHAIEADVKLNGAYHKWFTGNAVPSGCSNRFSIESTATHEFGHVFGLAHVSESSHGNLTMSPVMGPCTMSPATLGKGDVLGLRSLY